MNTTYLYGMAVYINIFIRVESSRVESSRVESSRVESSRVESIHINGRNIGPEFSFKTRNRMQ